jgi:hypothetical protein
MLVALRIGRLAGNKVLNRHLNVSERQVVGEVAREEVTAILKFSGFAAGRTETKKRICSVEPACHQA